MPPKKRRKAGSGQQHIGRVTVARRDESPVDRTGGATVHASRLRIESTKPGPGPSSRYTPPRAKTIRLRPQWHKSVGAAIAIAGLAVAVVNDVMLLGDTRDLLPGGHNELYLLLAFTTTGYSTRWFGWWDRAK